MNMTCTKNPTTRINRTPQGFQLFFGGDFLAIDFQTARVWAHIPFSFAERDLLASPFFQIHDNRQTYELFKTAGYIQEI